MVFGKTRILKGQCGTYNEIDFICDTGAVSGGMGLKVRKILFNT
jgi:hypothetical protein